VIHWWVSGGEARALKVIADRFTAAGGKWLDAPVAGGGGDAAKTVAKTRIVGGKPPTAMQWHLGRGLQELATEGLLSDVQEVAVPGNWDAVLPAMIAENAKVGSRYVAVPVGIHGENWLWYNPKVLAAAGVEPPTSWPAFNEAAAKLRAAGVIPLALGGQGWQEVIVFNTVVLGLGGPELFRKALVDLDPAVLDGEAMIRVFEQIRVLKTFVDPGRAGRDWNQATSLVITGKAAMQLMGDWAKGEFAAAGLEAGRDFGCAPSPGAGTAYIVAADAFALPKLASPDRRQGQLLLARTLMDPAVQRDFSLLKGSIPARIDVSPDGFDVCSRKAMDLVRAPGAALLPAIGSNMALTGAQAGAVADAVTLFFNSEMSAKDGARTLRRAVESAL
jgi:glucose/mannose transport system substrate-binding protein